MLVERPQAKDNHISVNVGIIDIKNEERGVRNGPGVQRANYPNYSEVPDFKLPETGKNIRNSELWRMLNMDALEVMSCFSYLVSIGEIDPKTGKGIKNSD